VLHCRTREEAETVLQSINERVEACNLELHKDKTKIVYCKDYRRNLKFDTVSFDFLGFTFKPVSMKSKREDGLFLGFGVDISKDSRKKIVENITQTKFNRRTTATIEEIAELLNPRLRGWLNYYGLISKRGLNQTLSRLHRRIAKWLLNKYKRLCWSFRRAFDMLKSIKASNPNLFAHWQAGYDL